MRYVHAYVGMRVRDVERSVAFYRGLLGMEVARQQEVELASKAQP